MPFVLLVRSLITVQCMLYLDHAVEWAGPGRRVRRDRVLQPLIFSNTRNRASSLDPG